MNKLRKIGRVAEHYKYMRNKLGVLLLLAVLAAISGCVHTELIYREFNGESLYIDVRILEGAKIDAGYHIKLDKDDPVGTIVSIGTSAAKAEQVAKARKLMNAAMMKIDPDSMLTEELGDFFSETMQMKIADDPQQADYRLVVEVDQYGIDADSDFDGAFFVLKGISRLYEISHGERVWWSWFKGKEEIGPAAFGLSDSAGNILDAVMLAGLEEDDMVHGIRYVTREAVWNIALEFEKDLDRARRERG